MQDMALIMSQACNVIMLILTALMYHSTVRADRRTKKVLDQSRRPHLMADLTVRRDRDGNDLSFLTVYNLNDFPAKNVRLRYDETEIENALGEKDHNDEFRIGALSSLAHDIPFVEKGKPILRPFGLQCPNPERSPDRCHTLPGEPDRSRTWKPGVVIRIRMDYQDLTGNPYQSDIQELNTDIYWIAEYPDHSL